MELTEGWGWEMERQSKTSISKDMAQQVQSPHLSETCQEYELLLGRNYWGCHFSWN